MRVRWLRFNKLYVISVCSILMAACGPMSSSEKSKISIQFPEVNQLVASKSSQSASSSYNWSQVCFVANITAPDLMKSSNSSCDVPIGIFKGSVAPGGTISLEVPKGYRRKLEIFTYLRSDTSSKCASLEGSFGILERWKIARVGEVSSFDTQEPEVNLQVSLSAPAEGVSILSQYTLPSSCQKNMAPATGPAHIANGHTRQTSSKFIVDSTVSARANEVLLEGGSFKLRLSRQER